MANETKDDGLDALRRNAKSPKDAEQFIAISTLLGGPKLALGVSRIIDGLCPDCGDDSHERCPLILEPKD